jgi:exodeoxyribonuclease V gamma subunit
MNNIPFKVIAFVGADEAAFAGSRADGDDVLSNDPRVGEPQYSLSGRENLMNLLMSARNKVIITCTGADVRNNKETPLAVPVQELIEHVASIIFTRGPVGHHRVLTQHGRHNFDLRTLEPGHVRDDVSFTFDDNSRIVWETLHSANEEGDQPTGDEAGVLLSTEVPQIRDIQQLLKIMSNPISYYYKEIFNVDIPEGPKKDEQFNAEENFVGDGVLALSLSNLAYSSEGRRLLQLIANFDGDHNAGWFDDVINEWRRVRPLTGLLPPGKVGELASKEIGSEVRKMIEILPTHLQTLQGDEIDCTVTFGPAETVLRVTDVVFFNETADFARTRFKRFTESLLLELWVELSALTIHLQGKPATAHLVARGNDDIRKKSLTPHHHQISIKGNSDDERLTNARKAIDVFSRFATIATQIPIDFFPSASSKIVREVGEPKIQKLKAALKDDLNHNSEIAWYLGDKSLENLLATAPFAEEAPLLGLLDVETPVSRMEIYANFVWGAYESTVFEIGTSIGHGIDTGETE